MADPYRYHGSPRQEGNRSGDSPKPQLPNFDHFVRSAGHPGLAQRNARQEHMNGALTPPGHPSLPTPPLTTSNRPFWEGGMQMQPQSQSQLQSQSQAWSAEHALDKAGRPFLAPEFHRRASFALPIQARPQARPTRAYSSTNLERPYHEFKGGPYGQVIQEESYLDHRTEYVYEGDDGVSKEVPGDGGSSIWGTTKAGKPRKRLSQACSTCREKKIKCDPGGGTKCSQCLRFNRECKFDTNSRQGHKSSKFRTSAQSSQSPGANNISHPLQEHLPSSRSSVAPSDVPPSADAAAAAAAVAAAAYRTASLSSTSADEVISPTMSDRLANDAPTPSKRQRVSPDLSDRPSNSNSSHSDTLRRNVNAHTYQFGFAAEVDPIVANDSLTRHYMELFMELINLPTFEIFPRSRMLQWVYTATKKTMPDRIAVYAMLALATVHSTDPQRAVHRALFKSIVHSQLDQLETAYSLQVAHTILYLAFAEFADSQFQKGYSLFVRAFGAIAFLRLNIEFEDEGSTTAYNFSPSMFAECRRRTFWAAYVTDIFSGLSKGDPRIMHATDVYLRMPCATNLYEEDTIPELPIFDQENVLTGIPAPELLAKMADMVHLIHIGTICSEIQLNAWRSRNAMRVGRQYVQDRSTRRKLDARLETWAETYNAALRVKESRAGNADVYTGNKDSGARARRYTGLDFVFHYAHMELNRRVYHKSLDNEELLSYAKAANVHALETLKLTQQLLKQGGSGTKDYYFAVRGLLGGYAVHTALDIITAAGSIADILAPQSTIMTLMWGGCELLEHLSAWWGTAHIQHLQAKERIQTVFNLCQAALYDQKTYFYCSEPMSDMGLDRNFDTIYGMDRTQYLRAAYGLSKVKDSEIFVIDTKRKQQKLVVS